MHQANRASGGSYHRGPPPAKQGRYEAGSRDWQDGKRAGRDNSRDGSNSGGRDIDYRAGARYIFATTHICHVHCPVAQCAAAMGSVDMCEYLSVVLVMRTIGVGSAARTTGSRNTSDCHASTSQRLINAIGTNQLESTCKPLKL